MPDRTAPNRTLIEPDGEARNDDDSAEAPPVGESRALAALGVIGAMERAESRPDGPPETGAMTTASMPLPGFAAGSPTAAPTATAPAGTAGTGMPGNIPGLEPRSRRVPLPAVLGTVVLLLALGAAAWTVWPNGRPAPAAPVRTAPGAIGAATPGPGGPTGAATPVPTAQPGEQGQGPAPIAPGEPAPDGSGAGAGTGGDPSAAAPPGAQTAPPVGPLVRGDHMTYQLMERDGGYFEGAFTITNPTSAPMSTWTLEFTVPGARVKTVWGGRLELSGDRAVIRNLPTGSAIPPGGSYEVRFGAEGAAADPGGCRINDRDCGF